MKLRASLLSLLLLAACTTAPPNGDPVRPAPLAEDRARPVLALFEHVLGDYLALAGEAPPTTCVVLRGEGDQGLSADEEEALLKRFPQLAPADRCAWDGAQYADAFTKERATVIDVYQFACSGDGACSGWVNTRGPGACRPAAQYRMSWRDGRWSFARDERLLAE